MYNKVINITGNWLTLWKQNMKDSKLTIYNILVEGVDNAIDALSRKVLVTYTKP